jgi:hypothetical protein
MPKPRTPLSANSLAVLEMIAAGNSYGQILDAHPHLTHVDIFYAAEEALLVSTREGHRALDTLKEKRKRHPRAYEKWTGEEEGRLRHLVRAGSTIAQIAGLLERNRGAIRSRVIKLNLVDELTPKEQTRLHRIERRIGRKVNY